MRSAKTEKASSTKVALQFCILSYKYLSRDTLIDLLSLPFEGKAGEILISVQKNSAGLQIQVRDNGHGFAQEWLDYGIRPFRTSRENGTGLGLSMVQRFVKNNYGILTLSNDNGAVVNVLFPNLKD